MTSGEMRYKLNEVRMMINDGEHIEEQGILCEVMSALDSCEMQGEWIRMGEAYVCSRCSTTCACTETADRWIWHIDDKFCRGCGADMRGE